MTNQRSPFAALDRRAFLARSLSAGACAGSRLVPLGASSTGGQQCPVAAAQGHGRCGDRYLASRRRLPDRHLGREAAHPLRNRHEGERAIGHLPLDSDRGRWPAVRRGAGRDRLGDGPRHARPQPDEPDEIRRRPFEGAVLHDDRLSVSGRGQGAQLRRRGRPHTRPARPTFRHTFTSAATSTPATPKSNSFTSSSGRASTASSTPPS